MSFFAGIFSLGGARIDAHTGTVEAASGLTEHYNISRFSTPEFFLIHGDLGILPERGWRSDTETVAAIAGSLYFDESTLSGNKGEQPELHAAASRLGHGEINLLARANGTFALCVYNQRNHCLRLASDSLGGRPLYYAVHSGLLFFATSIEVLKRLDLFPLTADLTSYFEQEAVYYPTGVRSTIREINVLIDNQVIEASRSGLDTIRYFDWSSVPQSAESRDELAAHCAAAFRAAMRCRIHSKRQASLLSGGLDSRLIVADLHDRGLEVETVNLAPEDSQDSVYARRFADVLGIPFSSVPWSPRVIGTLAGDSTASLLMAAQSGLAGRAVFSGDGGGETFGFLLMNDVAASLFAKGNLREGVAEYLSHYQPPKRLFRDPEMRGKIAAGIYERFEKELRKFQYVSPEKSLHIFTLCHDMRRHLYGYFNRVSEARTELLLPFYDRRVIESVIRIPAPLTPLLKHKFYHRMLDFLPSSICSVSWQTYPGHAPCPVPDPDPPADQWSRHHSERNDFAVRCARLMLTPRFPAFLRRRVALAAIVSHGLGRENYDYLFKACINLAGLVDSCDSYSTSDESQVLDEDLVQGERQVS